MNSMVNVRMPPELLAQTETVAKERGYLTVQEYVREAVRQDIERYRRLRRELDAIVASAKGVKARKLTVRERERLAEREMSKLKRLYGVAKNKKIKRPTRSATGWQGNS